MEFEIGERVLCVDGPLQGNVVTIAAQQGNQFEVTAQLFGKDVELTLNGSVLRPLSFKDPWRRVRERLERDAEIGMRIFEDNWWGRVSLPSTAEERIGLCARYDNEHAHRRQWFDKRLASELARLQEEYDDQDVLMALDAEKSLLPFANAFRNGYKPSNEGDRILQVDKFNKPAAAFEARRELQLRAQSNQRICETELWRAQKWRAQPDETWLRSFQEELARDDDKDFSAELFRQSEVAWRGMQQYGLIALREIWRENYGKGALIPLEHLPDSHPWSKLAGWAPHRIIESVFAAGGEDVEAIAALLRAQIRQVAAVRHEQVAEHGHFAGYQYGLVYIVDGFHRALVEGEWLVTDTPRFIVANPPASDDTFSSYAKDLEWEVPSPLAALYRCHNGIGSDLSYGSADTIPRASDLRVLGEVMNEIVRAQDDEPEDFCYDDLLGFFEDGFGNGQYFHRTQRKEGELLTVDWDHETREISGAQTFAEFITSGRPARVWIGYDA